MFLVFTVQNRNEKIILAKDIENLKDILSFKYIFEFPEVFSLILTCNETLLMMVKRWHQRQQFLYYFFTNGIKVFRFKRNIVLILMVIRVFRFQWKILLLFYVFFFLLRFSVSIGRPFVFVLFLFLHYFFLFFQHILCLQFLKNDSTDFHQSFKYNRYWSELNM